MPEPGPTHLFCVGLGDRVRGIPAGVRRRLVVVVVLLTAIAVVLLTAIAVVVLGADIATVVEVLALPPAAVKLADLAVGASRRRNRPALQGR
ncbi:hypothetical protein [Kitasatospora aureofaciens]|uniref:hypothetical protein n=1 Tax=Kitasatospora aureofaciens TaxID=1894 RepID=UPI000526B971|nr:hypothetical protein [Kitasatospora aureofaciens]